MPKTGVASRLALLDRVGFRVQGLGLDGGALKAGGIQIYQLVYQNGSFKEQVLKQIARYGIPEPSIGSHCFVGSCKSVIKF